MRISADELRSVAQPTLFVWGKHDPFGSFDSGLSEPAGACVRVAALRQQDRGAAREDGRPEQDDGRAFLDHFDLTIMLRDELTL